MTKRTNTPPAADPQEIDGALITLAEMVLTEYFFDPDKEAAYKQKLLAKRSPGSTGVLLDEESIEVLDAVCALRLEALRTWTCFRVTLSHPAFSAWVEGTWSFEREELTKTRTDRIGDPATVQIAVDLLIEDFEDGDLDDQEFADFLEGLDDEDDDEIPLIGDDPTEPPAATTLDRNRVKAIAKRISRDKACDINVEDRAWLEQTPQTLPVITDALVGAAGATKRDEPLILAYQLMLVLQLEFVRYRQDREWEWADDMLLAYQQRLIDLAKAGKISPDDWFLMCAALTEARVPVSDAVQTALADAGFKPVENGEPPEPMMRTIRAFMDELARMVSSPFEVIHTLQNSGALMPAALRGFMSTELALSPHPVLRDAVPLMLLDDDRAVRKAAAGALEQTARPETLSPDALRRAITLRNWIPAKDRPYLDAAVRKARLAGVEIGAWPKPIPDLEFHVSTIDGSGAQSILIASRSGKQAFLGGLLLRHGVGVVDTWADQDLSRGKINKLLRESQMSAPFARVDKSFVDTMVQHVVGTSVEQETTPSAMLLEVAELLGATEWKDRRLNVAAEAERLFGALDPADRTPEGIEAGFARGLGWMADDDGFRSWFEDGPQVQQALAKLPRTDRLGMTALVLTEILPEKRAVWAERFLMMALWHEAAADAKQRAKARDLVLVAHALTGDGPVGEIPIMAVIAMQTVRATLLGAW
jgi:hypothetical protein